MEALLHDHRTSCVVFCLSVTARGSFEAVYSALTSKNHGYVIEHYIAPMKGWKELYVYYETTSFRRTHVCPRHNWDMGQRTFRDPPAHLVAKNCCLHIHRTEIFHWHFALPTIDVSCADTKLGKCIEKLSINRIYSGILHLRPKIYSRINDWRRVKKATIVHV